MVEMLWKVQTESDCQFHFLGFQVLYQWICKTVDEALLAVFANYGRHCGKARQKSDCQFHVLGFQVSTKEFAKPVDEALWKVCLCSSSELLTTSR
jgi:hypothetical protein